MTEKKLRNIAISGADPEKINLKAVCNQILLLSKGGGGDRGWVNIYSISISQNGI